MRIDYNLGMMSTRYKSGGHLLFSYNLGKMRLYRGLPPFFCSVGDTISSLNRGWLQPTPVSYTPLDVYKRQIYGYAELFSSILKLTGLY